MSLKLDDHQIKAFWSKVAVTDDPNECWEWEGARKPKGYGNVRINKKYLLAHRVAFELAVSEIPSGLIVCHICDNPSCCNPRHLMLGTQASNLVDMIIKNRAEFRKNKATGTRNTNAKLNDDAVRTIRKSELNAVQLADLYQVSPTTIRQVIHYKTWRHVKDGAQ